MNSNAAGRAGSGAALISRLILCLGLAASWAARGQANMERFMLDPENMNYVSKGGLFVINQVKLNLAPEGSPYLWTDWTPGKIILEKNREANGYRMNYNMAEDNFQVEIKKGVESSVINLNPQRVKTLVVMDKTFFPLGAGYAELIVAGKFSLVKKYKAELKEQQYVAGISSGHENPKWKTTVTYFLMDSTKKITEVSGRKDFLKAIGKTGDATAEKMARQTDFKKEEKLKELWAWLNRQP